MNLREMLIRHEGLRLKAYKCSAGKWTIGVGHNFESDPEHIKARYMRPEGISKEECMALLDQDIAKCEIDANKFPWYSGLDPVRQDVIVSMIFNLGLRRFSGFKKTIGAVAQTEYELAAKMMLDSKWAEQVGNRAKELSQLMAYGSYERVFDSA